MGKEEKTAGPGGGAAARRGPSGAAEADAGRFRGAQTRTNSLHPSHFGPGSQWGKPYYHLGQECEKVAGDARSPLALSSTELAQTRANNRFKERTLSVYADLPSQRSQRVTVNKDGLSMDSRSHYTKIGSKHMCDARPDHSQALYRSASLPHLHPYDQRRSQFKDPAPWYHNAAFSTTSQGIGLFYSGSMNSEPLLHNTVTMHWRPSAPGTPASCRSSSSQPR